MPATITGKKRTAPPARGEDSVPVPDAAMTAIIRLYDRWILPYSWRLGLVFVGVLLAVAAVRALAAHRADRSGAGFAAISKAKDTDALLAVARDYDGTPVAARAQLEAARRLFEEGKYDQAAAKFALARKNGAALEGVRTAAALGEAYALEADGKPETAEKLYTELAGRPDSKALALDAWLGAARCAKAQGKLAEAEKYCERARDAAGDSPFLRRRVDEVRAAVSAARYARAPAADAAPAEGQPPQAAGAEAAPPAQPPEGQAPATAPAP